MIKLIKAEIKKIFHKKSIYIVSLIFLGFTCLANYVYKSNPNMDTYYNSYNIPELIEQNKYLDLNNENDIYTYMNNESIIKTHELKNKYKLKWQKNCIEEHMQSVFHDTLYAKYILKNDEDILKYSEIEEKYIKALDSEDWKFFTNKDIEKYKEFNSFGEENKERDKEVLALYEYRLQNNVLNDDSFLDRAIDDKILNSYEYYNLKNKSKLTSEETSRLADLEEERTLQDYILKEKKDINSNDNLRGVLSNFNSEFGIFILIYAIMFAGSVVSEEFNKGTIKSLLTKPYKRSTILLSKLIAVIGMLLISIIGMCLVELVVGGIMLGFDSLSIPIVIYSSGSLIEYNVISYLILSILATLPSYLIIALIAFMISTISASTSAAITISFIFYLVSNIINAIALTYNLKILKLFIPLYWDFSHLLKHTSHPLNISTGASIGMCVLYVALISIITFIFFNKKDVKNI